MKTRDERALELAQYAFQLSRKIVVPVDVHKRYWSHDLSDPYARLIEFVHHEGSTIWPRP